MQIFFSSLDAIEQYTSSLNVLEHSDTCQHCAQSDQWVSHGYVYKQRSADQREVVGKRILCSRRYAKSGCGRSRQLYLHTTLPRRRYTMQTLLTFVMLLLKGLRVTQAYRDATEHQHIEPRHAWRWLNVLTAQLGRWRSALGRRPDTDYGDTLHRTRRLRILLPTLQLIFPTLAQGMSFQYRQQQAIF